MDTGGDFRPVRFMIWDHLFFFGWYKGRWNLFHFWEVQQGPTKITQLEGPPKGDLFIWGPTFVVHIMWKWLVGGWDDHIYCASRNCHRNPCGVQTPHFKASKINMASGTCQKPVWFQFGCSPKQPIPTGRIFMPSHARNIPQWMVMSLIIGPVYTLSINHHCWKFIFRFVRENTLSIHWWMISPTEISIGGYWGVGAPFPDTSSWSSGDSALRNQQWDPQPNHKVWEFCKIVAYHVLTLV